ncbi:hypothetical protein N7451_010240 [Penicillium sp. IBT 35674x]|nr:hypothetical protein N7451_010240 [Penicillium sp. IBT 35674x]
MIPEDQRLIALKRRRTQVKLAQRAYRQRKDDTLAALGRQCDDLKETIRNINEAFNGFYSETCDSGIGSREPKHIHYLIQIAKYIGDLADLALDEASKIWKTTDINQGVRERNKKSNKAMPNSQFEERSSQAQWSFQPRALLNQAALDGISANWNASFTAGIPELCISDTGGGVVEAMDPLNDFLCPSPMLDSTYLTLHTNTVERATFARRLQRDALERGFELVTNPNTPLSILNYAFEHCLPVRSREQITYRLQVLLKQSDLGAFLGPKNDDDQQNMPKDSQSNLINQIFGTGSPSRLPNGLGLFPQVREPESGLSQSSQEFLSAQDVESYLTSKGIVITSSSKLLQLKIPQDQPAWQPKSYQAAILSVNKLIESQPSSPWNLECCLTTVFHPDVLDRAVCLFTGPGFRKVDVESALRTSIRVSA